MGHYKSNLRDIEFNLFEVLRRQDLLGARAVRRGGRGDRARHPGRGQPAGQRAPWPSRSPRPTATRRSSIPRRTRSSMPEGFKKSYQAFMDAEWFRLELPRRAGRHQRPALAGLGRGRDDPRGQPGGLDVRQRRLVGARAVAHGHARAAALRRAGGQRKWTATMVLTEPDAGSDVGAGRTKAVAAADGTWHIEGVKRFITSAEHDMAENIFHLVLARPDGRRAGHQGPVDVPRAQVPGRPGR